jgi:hypothetical protein
MMRYAISMYGYLKAVAAVYCVQKDLENIPVEAILRHVAILMHELHEPMEWRSEIAGRIAQIESGVW